MIDVLANVGFAFGAVMLFIAIKIARDRSDNQ